MNLMADNMQDTEDKDITLKVEVLLLLIGTLFQTAKQGQMLKREEWLITAKRIHQLLDQVNKKQFKAQLKKCQEKDAAAAEKRLLAKDNEEENEGMAFEEEDMTDPFEVERSVFPSLSNFIERMDEQLWKSF
jgi:hypothetical protein